MKYAGFWVRVWASVVDSLISLFVVVPVIALAGRGWANAYNDAAAAGIVFVANCLVGWLYFALFESRGWQATPGKRLLGLRVTDLAGNRISFGRASGRYFSKLLSFLIFYIGFIMVGLTDKKQGLHDKMVDTLVLRGNAGTADPNFEASYPADEALSQTVYVTQSLSKRWIISGFDGRGHVVRLNFSQDNPKLGQEGLLIGREAKTCDLQINDLSVSRLHARLFSEQGTIWLEDRGSTNGTLVNGRVVKKGKAVELPPQGAITFGAVELTLARY